jgi:hypothetical protein
MELMMVEAGFSEMAEHFYWPTRRHIPEDSITTNLPGNDLPNKR